MKLLTALLAACLALAAGPVLAQEAAPPVQDVGDTAWILTATALVLFMTLPGLALFYAGLVRSKNVLSVMMHCVAIACLASLLWLRGGYSLAFSGAHPLLGDLAKFGLISVGRGDLSGELPENLFFMFQLTLEETDRLRCQIGTSNEGRGGRRYLPYVLASTALRCSPQC